MQSTSKEPAAILQPQLDQLQKTRENAEAYFLGDDKLPPHRLIKALEEDIQMVLITGSSLNLHDENLTKTVIEARRIQRRLERLVLDSKPGPAASSSSQQAPDMYAGWKLPPPPMPTFDGDASKYPFYRGILMTEVIENSKMHITAKWSIFRNSLSGYPADLVSKHPPSEAGLTSALSILDQVFRGTDKAIAELERKLSELPAGQDTESCLMNYGLLQGILMSLAHFGHPVDTDPSIRSQYRQKFPPEVSSAIAEDDMPLQQMQEVALKVILEARNKGEELGRPALSEQPKNDAVQEHCASSE